MYKNFKGLNVEQEPQQPVVEEDSLDDRVQYDAHGFATVHHNDKFYLIFNDEVVGEYDTVDELKSAHEHVINKIKLPENVTANIGNTSFRSDGKDVYAKGRIGSTDVSADTKGNAYAKGKIAGGTMATAVNRSGEGGASFTDSKGRTVSKTAGDSDAWMSPGPNQPSRRIRAEGIDMKLEEEFNKQLEEGMTVNTTSNKDQGVEDTVIVNADGNDAKELIMMLKNAGIDGEVESKCGTCMDTEAPSEMSQGSEQDALMQMLQMAGMDTDNVTVMPLNADCGGQHESVEEDLANAPDEKYADTDYMINKLAGGINKPKNMYRQAADGDNPMRTKAMPVTDLEESLMKEYNDFVPEGLNIIKKAPSADAQLKVRPQPKVKKQPKVPTPGTLVGESEVEQLDEVLPVIAGAAAMAAKYGPKALKALKNLTKKKVDPASLGQGVAATATGVGLAGMAVDKLSKKPPTAKADQKPVEEDHPQGLEGRGGDETNSKSKKSWFIKKPTAKADGKGLDGKGLDGRGLGSDDNPTPALRSPKAKADDWWDEFLNSRLFDD